jgi:hypothetical protein
MIKITYTPPYMLYSYTESKKKYVFHTYALLLHWELAQTFLSSSPQTCLSTFPQNKLHVPRISVHSPYKSEKRDMGYMLWKKRVRKDEEKNMEIGKKSVEKKKRMSIKDSPWSQSSRFGERIFKESTFYSYPHTCTVDHVYMLFPPWIHAWTLQYKHPKYAFWVLVPQTPHKL